MKSIPRAYLPTSQVKIIILAALKERLSQFEDGTETWGDQKHQTLDAITWMQQQPVCNPAPQPAPQRKAAETCGDINCDGQCQAPAPELIRLIDNCASVEAARDELNLSSASQRWHAAKFLNVPASDLTAAITRRVRARLLSL
jgi:hypothetical protein